MEQGKESEVFPFGYPVKEPSSHPELDAIFAKMKPEDLVAPLGHPGYLEEEQGTKSP